MHNKTIKSLLFIISLSLSPALACAKSSPYVRADVGAAFPQKLDKTDYGKKSPKESIIYGIGAGYGFNDYVRADFTISRMHNFKFNHNVMLDSGLARIKQDINSTQLLVNGYFDIINCYNFTPYVGAGLGVAYNQAKDYKNVTSGIIQKGGHKTNFAWNLGAGLSYKFTQNIAMDLSYKYHDLGKIKSSQNALFADGTPFTSTAVKSRLKAHAVTLGARYTF